VPNAELEPRKQAVLKAVVTEFTVTAVPVGSHQLVTRHFVNLSPATIRNELSELGELGYLVQPHTSAGRVPTDRGYRYFVDFLMEVEPVPHPIDSYVREQLAAAPPEIPVLVERVATVLAQVTRNAAVASTPHGSRPRIKHLDLVSLEGAEILIVLLVEGNLLRQSVVEVSRPVTQTELTRLANKLNRRLAGREREELRRRQAALGPDLEMEVLGHLDRMLERFERGGESLALHDGVRNLLRQPEFAEAARLHEVLEVLEESRHLASLLQDLVADSDLEIVIGSENQTSQLRSCTLVLTTYGPSRQLRGVLGVVGPTRMDYGQVVARLRTVAHRASERMAEACA
jgi:heat-inducible transcriptional repressor